MTVWLDFEFCFFSSGEINVMRSNLGFCSHQLHLTSITFLIIIKIRAGLSPRVLGKSMVVVGKCRTARDPLRLGSRGFVRFGHLSHFDFEPLRLI